MTLLIIWRAESETTFGSGNDQAARIFSLSSGSILTWLYRSLFSSAGTRNTARSGDRSSRRRPGLVFVGTGASHEFVSFFRCGFSRSVRIGSVEVLTLFRAQMTPALLQHHLKPEEKVLQPEKHEEHAVYISIFDSYPLLRSRPLLQIDSSIISLNPQTSPSLASSSNPNHTNISSPSHNVSYTPSSSFFMSRHLSPSLLPDLRPLRLATASQFLGSSKRLCQYEIPGGGRCADAGCEDIHISRMGGSASMDANVEPGGE